MSATGGQTVARTEQDAGPGGAARAVQGQSEDFAGTGPGSDKDDRAPAAITRGEQSQARLIESYHHS